MNLAHHPLTRILSAWGVVLLLLTPFRLGLQANDASYSDAPALGWGQLVQFNQAQRCGPEGHTQDAGQDSGHCLKCWVSPIALERAGETLSI